MFEKFLNRHPELKELKKALFIEDIVESSGSFLIEALRRSGRDILLITGGKSRDAFINNLTFFESSFLEITSLEDEESVGQRYNTLYSLKNRKKPTILISSLLSSIQKVVGIEGMEKSFYLWQKGKKESFSQVGSFLTSLGYQKTAAVSAIGEFALRGGIVDLFSPASSKPYRIEFFGDEIETIRTFDPSSQLSIEKVEKALICPREEKSDSSIFEYLKNPLIIFDDPLILEDSFVKLSLKKEDIGPLVKRASFFFSRHKLSELTDSHELFNLKLDVTPIPSYFWKVTQAMLEDEKIDKVLLSETEKEKTMLSNIRGGRMKQGYLSSAFFIPDLSLLFYPATEITHSQKLKHKVINNVTIPLSEFHLLEIGDPVVHFHFGIGKYLGIEKEGDKEFIAIEYANKSKVFVPLSQAHLVSRYIGSREESPTLSDLGSKKWQNAKREAQKQITGYASDLLKLYAERAIEGGHIFPPDSEEDRLFESEFPYSETIDQLRAIEDVKKDMCSPKAMDRLICGDVGYGKTEVAIRAAFKASLDGKKQVVLLAPTTVLAQQHYEVFKERMAHFPINIELVSRFNSAKKNSEIIERTKEGQVDIVVGTHRLLSKDVAFKDLGLIIIDEEQRFGVRSKEYLKKIKKGVDCLTLSATPIPRTLYMSLINVRDMSTINTPPQERMPIKTILAETDDNIIKDAILKEISREGQIFFIHNRVETIEAKKEYLQNLFPHASIIVVHGQMDADSIDLCFHKFKEGSADILVATSIVENGIDIPNANTIIIDRADNFGLADLYQLRGRVGRSSRSAYAYLLTPQRRELSEIASKRLKALVESGPFGGGMKIAIRDLEIRGAGDILGVHQSGQISSIGFHLYCKLLKKTIASLKNNIQPTFQEVKMEFNLPASIPDSYVEDTSLRMELYHRLGEVTSQNMNTIFKEMEDRFGPYPSEVVWLYQLTKLRLKANENQLTFFKICDLSVHLEKNGQKNSFILPKKITKPEDLELISALLDKLFK